MPLHSLLYSILLSTILLTPFQYTSAHCDQCASKNKKFFCEECQQYNFPYTAPIRNYIDQYKSCSQFTTVLTESGIWQYEKIWVLHRLGRLKPALSTGKTSLHIDTFNMPLLAILYEFELNQQKLSTLIPGRTLTPIIEKDDLIELTILLAGYFDIRVSGDIQTALTIAYAAFFISKKRSPETESEFIEFHANLLYALTLATNARYRTPYINGIARLVNNSRRSELIRELDERQTTDLKLASCCLHRYCPDEKLEKLVNIASIPHKLDLNNPDWQKSLKTDSQLACLETVSHHRESNSAQQRKNTNRVFITQPGSKKNDNIFVFLPQQLAYYQCPNDQLINDLNQLHASPATASTTDPTLEEHCKAYLDPKVEIYTGNRTAFKLMCLGTLCTWAYAGYKYHSGNTDFTLPEKAACAVMPLATLHQAFKTLTLADFRR